MPRRFAADTMLHPTGAPIVVVHRDGAGECPENTAEAFLTMGEQDFCYLETDVRTTLDGVAVPCHDAILDRIIGATGKACGYMWRELARVCGDEPTVLRVDEALERHPDAVLNIDVKSDDVAAPLVRAIREAGVQSRVCIASFSERRPRRMRGELPETASPLGIGVIAKIVAASRARTEVAHRRLLKGLPDAQAVQVPLSFRGIPVSVEKFVASVHGAGIVVHAWTIDDVDVAVRLPGMGVDGIITNASTAMYEGLRG